MPNRRPYPTDVSEEEDEEEWALSAPPTSPCWSAKTRPSAPTTCCARSSTPCVRWIVRAGARPLLADALHHDFPPWEALYQQTQRWLAAGVFEAMAHELLRGLLCG
jgi:hypothetical protein